MKAIFVNSQQQELGSSPGEVVEVFLGAYPAGLVSDLLWRCFGFAVVGGLEGSGGVTAEEVALLLDQLINLVGALETLDRGGRASLFILGEDRHD